MDMKKQLAAVQQDKNNTWPLLIESRLNKLYYTATEHENRYGLHASAVIASDNDFCYREQILSLFFEMNQGEQLPIGLLRIFATGNALHEKWYNLFRKAKIDVAIERTLFLEKYDLNFTIDALLDFGNGEELICDVKSMNTFSFNKSKGHPSGEKQINFYLWALSKYTGKPHKRGFVLRDSKNDSNFSVVPVYYDKEKVKPYVERLKQIQVYKKQFIEERKMPVRKCMNCDTKRAVGCAMRDACWNIGKGRVRIKDVKQK